MKLVRVWVVALLGSWVVLGLSLGSAQAIGIGSDRIIVKDLQGNTISDQTLIEGAEGTTATITINSGISAGQTFLHQIDLVEPDGRFSDHVRAVEDDTLGPIRISFCSDENDATCLTLLNNVTVPETGELQDVSVQLGVDDWVTVLVQSDLEAAPEPGTLLLLAAGFGGLVGTAWRRHRRK